MGNTEMQAPSKRVRIVLSLLAAVAVMAAAPASGLAADWSSKPTKTKPTADWSS